MPGTRTNKTIVNTVGGELSPQMYARLDLPIFGKGMAKVENFISTPQGGCRYRNGTVFVHNTFKNKTAVLIPFQFSDQQAYLIEATDKLFRFYKDNGIILEDPKTITAMTNANPGVFTSAAHGYTEGDEIQIAALVGPSGINGKFYFVTAVTANTFSITDLYGNIVNTATSGAYTSGGTASRVYSVTSPYREADLVYMQMAQSADTGYIVANRNYPPYKLTRTAHNAWTLTAEAFTNDPFISTVKNITGITQAIPGVVTSVAHGFVNGQLVNIAAVTGMTQLNGNQYVVASKTADTFALNDAAGNLIDTTVMGAYIAAGTATTPDKYPGAVSFTDAGRLLFGGTRANPQTVWGSKAPSTGTTAFDDFTTGTAATDAIIFTLEPVHGKVDTIQWIDNSTQFGLIGTFGSIRTFFGASQGQPLSPVSITVNSIDNVGAALAQPVSNGVSLFYIQRAGLQLRNIEYDFSIQNYDTVDMNLVSEHLTKEGLKSIVAQQAQPDVSWVTKYDGRLLGLTYKRKEDISGWHRHFLGGSHVNTKKIKMPRAKVLGCGIMLRPSLSDQLWFVVERVVNGVTTRSIEYMADQPVYPLRNDFNTNATISGGETLDNALYLNALYETQKDAVHLDMSAAFDGSGVGTSASATVTPSAISGTGIMITSNVDVFDAAMVGREIWKQYDINGNGGGRAYITAYVNPRNVTCTVKSAFDNVSGIAPGNWFLTATTISGLDHLNGEAVSVCADGGYLGEQVVAAGSITLTTAASKATAGYKYQGTLESLNLDSGGITGSAEAKPRNLIKVAFRFLNSIGCKFGTSIYRLQQLVFQSTGGITDRPPPPFSGIKEWTYGDNWEASGKRIIVVQDTPAPCILTSMDLFLETADDQ